MRRPNIHTKFVKESWKENKGFICLCIGEIEKSVCMLKSHKKGLIYTSLNHFL